MSLLDQTKERRASAWRAEAYLTARHKKEWKIRANRTAENVRRREAEKDAAYRERVYWCQLVDVLTALQGAANALEEVR